MASDGSTRRSCARSSVRRMAAWAWYGLRKEKGAHVRAVATVSSRCETTARLQSPKAVDLPSIVHDCAVCGAVSATVAARASAPADKCKYFMCASRASHEAVLRCLYPLLSRVLRALHARHQPTKGLCI